MSLRPVRQIMQTKPTIDGAGVKLERAFGFGTTKGALDRKSTRLNSSHEIPSRMPSSA